MARNRNCQEWLLFYFVTLPLISMLALSHVRLMGFVDCFDHGSGVGAAFPGFGTEESQVFRNELGEAGQDVYSAILTRAIGRNVSGIIRAFLQHNPAPLIENEQNLDDDDDYAYEDGQLVAETPIMDDDASVELLMTKGRRVQRKRRYVIRDPNELNGILNQMGNAYNWTVLTTQLNKLANFFWYGEWCGAGWSKINESEANCCRCRDGVRSTHVDTTLIRNTANDCVFVTLFFNQLKKGF